MFVCALRCVLEVSCGVKSDVITGLLIYRVIEKDGWDLKPL